MSEKIKFTTEELAEIKNLQDKFQGKVFLFGQFRLERMHLLRLVKELETRETKTEEEYIALQTDETSLLEKLMEKYGAGQLNLADGSFTPEKNLPPTPTATAP
jgi:Holliday junction resolvase